VYFYHSLTSCRRTLPEVTHKIHLDVTIDGGKKQRITIGLFGKVAPRTVENFRSLATCSQDSLGVLTKKPLCYKNTKFHRIIPHFMIQGGDFSHFDGRGGESIYGGRFEDENLGTPLNHPYLVAMSNLGTRDSNGSQFFITTAKTQWLSGKHSVFGTVLEGREVVDEIETWGSYDGTPQGDIRLVDCSEGTLTAEDKKVRYE